MLGVSNTEWEEFRNHCLGQVTTIVNNEDDGYYAKRYAVDVSRLLAMLDSVARSNEGAECVSDAWEDTK